MPQVTFNIAASIDDQNVYRRQVATWPPTSAVLRDTAGGENYLEKDYNAGRNDFSIQNGLFRWDTSSLPDGATVYTASLRMRVSVLANTDSKSVTAGWYTWDGVSDTDYSQTAETNAISGVAVSSLTVGAYNTFPLSNLQNVSTTGVTYLRLHLSDGAQPTGDNYVGYKTIDDVNFIPPQLIVDYSFGTRIAPDAILAQTNLTGAVSAIQDDPDSPDASWLTAP